MSDGRLLFSEVRGAGVHMGIVAATESRAESRDVYFPAHDRAMAHFSAASPDLQNALVVEMDRTGAWEPCRLVPLDGKLPGREVGPDGGCTSVAWSPDGRWMYFSAVVGGSQHLWRQAFPDGSPEQITFGATEEEGLAMAPDGRSLITSIGTSRSAVWVHDPAGERAISTEGYAYRARLSRDGKQSFYLSRQNQRSSAAELRVANVATGASESVFPGQAVQDFDLSPDGNAVVFSTRAAQIWIAPLDRSAPPRQLASEPTSPRSLAQPKSSSVNLSGATNTLARLTIGQGQPVPFGGPIIEKFGVSPDGRWVLPVPIRPQARTRPQSGRSRFRSTAGRPGGSAGASPTWSYDGRTFYVVVGNRFHWKDDVLGAAVGQSFPDAPLDELSQDLSRAIPGGGRIDRPLIAPGPSAATYAFVQADSERNLFRIPLH